MLFWPTIVGLVGFWERDPDFSHGFLIPVVSAALLWSSRAELARLRAAPSRIGLVVLLLSLAVYFVGHVAPFNLFQRVGMWGALIGAIWYALGSPILLRRPFPFLFLLLCIPPPFFILEGVRLSLKNFATQISSSILMFLGYPANTEGNILSIGDHHFEVADACSGIRSLMAITTTAILFAYVFRAGWFKGSLLWSLAVPITVATNILRILSVAIGQVKLRGRLDRGHAAHDPGLRHVLAQPGSDLARLALPRLDVPFARRSPSPPMAHPETQPRTPGSGPPT